MNTQEAKTRLDTLIRARCPIIGIETAETRRFLEAMIDIIEEDSKRVKRTTSPRKKLFTFSVSRGLWQMATYTGEFTIEQNDHTREVPAVIYDEKRILEPGPDPAWFAYELTQTILENDAPKAGEQEPSCIYVLKDAHPFFEEPLFVRGLRDLAEVLIKRHQTIILVSPDLSSLPSVLRKDVKIITWPLPGADELQDQLDSFVANLDGSQVDLNGKSKELVEALRGLTMTEADQVLAETVINHGILDERAIGFTITAKSEIIRQSGALEFFPPETSMGDVGGMDLFKAWLHKAGKTNGPDAKAFGIKPARGVLVVGVPGCGKSLMAKAMSQEWGVPTLKQDWGAMFGSLVGESESNTRMTFKVAMAVGKCILWWDEIEKAVGSQGGERDGGTQSRVLGTALTWMEEEAADAGVFIYATANDITQLRPEFIRRFTEIFFVDLPAADDRLSILEIHLRKSGRAPGVFDLSTVVDLTVNFTGAECEEVVQGALWGAFDQQRELTVTDLEQAAKETVPLFKTMKEKIENMRTWSTRARPASSKQTTGRQVLTQSAGGSRAAALEM